MLVQRVEKNEKYYYCCYHRLLLLGMLNSSIFFKTNKGAPRNSYVFKSRLIVIMHRGMRSSMEMSSSRIKNIVKDCWGYHE